MDDLLTDFLTEVGEGLAELDTALVTLERTPGDKPTLALIFRQVHTIKGTCGFLGLPRLERVAHAAEDVLGLLRDGTLAPAASVIDHVLAALDRIRLIVDGLGRTGEEPAGDDSTLIAGLAAISAGGAPMPAAGAPVLEAEAGAASAFEPPPEPANDRHPDALPANAATPDGAAFAGATVRVGVDTLETLMTLVGELVLTRNQLLQIARHDEGTAFGAPLQRLSRLATELQEVAMKTRMQPVGTAWNKLPRLVRDLSHELGKPIELVMQGAETELDRQVLEQIRDPLTHIIRNAADHGLEEPDARLRAGKPASGRITLVAYHEGGCVIIEVSDDGRGLATDRIRDRILSRGLAAEADIAAMTERQIQQFVFVAGFSTADAITSVSGRGVGMDVVRSNIERISGTVDLRSQAGTGTTVTIRIPLTLAIVPGLVVRAGAHRFVVPQLAVRELVRAASGGDRAVSVETLGGNKVLRLRHALLPLVDLALLFGLEAGAKDDDRIIVVTQAAGGVFGMVVDEVFDTEEIVVKPVAPPLKHLAPFGGTTILGDGSVTMILDPVGIRRTAALGSTSGGDADPAADQGTEVAGDEAATMRCAMLLFRAAGDMAALPLDAVTRLEVVSRDAIEQSGGRLLMQYRGRLMPLLPIGPLVDAVRHDVLVLTDGAHQVGLLVDAIVDIVEAPLRIELCGGRPGIVGTAVLDGRATEVIDPLHYVERARRDRAGEAVPKKTKGARRTASANERKVA